MGKKWISFKYKNLPTFCFGCGKLGHRVQNCKKILKKEKEKPMEDFQFANVLRVESSLFGKEIFKLGFFLKKLCENAFLQDG